MEDVEEILERVEHNKPAPPEKQPEVPTQTGDVHVQDQEKSKTTEGPMLERMMEMFKELKKDIGETSKKLDSNTEENSKRMEENLSLIHI